MAATATLYNPFRAYLLDGTIDLDTDPIAVMLLSSGYTPSVEHSQISDIAAYEITGTGYTSGGRVLSGKTVSHSGANAAFVADNPTWTGLTATFRYAALYAQASRNGVSGPLIGYILLDATPADVVVAGIDYTITWNAAGVVVLA
jgi:hypothetical protein